MKKEMKKEPKKETKPNEIYSQIWLLHFDPSKVSKQTVEMKMEKLLDIDKRKVISQELAPLGNNNYEFCCDSYKQLSQKWDVNTLYLVGTAEREQFYFVGSDCFWKLHVIDKLPFEKVVQSTESPLVSIH